MKKFILAALAASIVATPMAAVPASAAPLQQREQYQSQTVRHGPNRTTVVTRKVTRNHAPSYRSNWRKGERFNAREARNYRVVNDYRSRHLKAPPRGYRYVQSGNDALLVGVTSGVIAAVLAGALR